jgi:translation initiation factor 3 subunit K
LYADLIADVAGFEELMRVRVATTVSQAVREVDRSILESWLNLEGSDFEHFVGSVCGWNLEGDKIKVPTNKDNEAKGTVVRENVKFDRKCRLPNVPTSILTKLQNSQGSSKGRTNNLRERHKM